MGPDNTQCCLRFLCFSLEQSKLFVTYCHLSICSSVDWKTSACSRTLFWIAQNMMKTTEQIQNISICSLVLVLYFAKRWRLTHFCHHFWWASVLCISKYNNPLLPRLFNTTFMFWHSSCRNWSNKWNSTLFCQKVAPHSHFCSHLWWASFSQLSVNLIVLFRKKGLKEYHDISLCDSNINYD